MIKPKHSFSSGGFEIKESFIDRKEAVKLYKEKLENNTLDYNILVYYGIGGIGKSKLCKELQRIHTTEYDDSLVFYLDLNAADDRNLGTGILKLVDSCNKKIDFRCFELAYAIYYKKKYPSSSYDRNNESITDNTLIGIGLNIIGILDNGITSTTADIIERSIKAISNRTIDRNVREELKKFNTYPIDVMEEMLPLFFRYDLLCYINKHHDTKILMVIDTFEALNENVLEPIHRRRNERWVQDMISYFDSESFPNLLITIFGRESINWDDDWDSLIIQYHLMEFENNYSKEYLLSAGITDENLVKLLISNSKGYPLLLYLSMVTYANIVNRGDVPRENDFGSNKADIIERFLYNLDKETVELLRLLAVPNFYNKDIVYVLVTKYNVSFPLTEFEQFNKYSFVSFDNNEEDYYLHELLRSGILDNMSDELRRSIHSSMIEYYSNIIQTEKSRTKSFIEILYHIGNVFSADEFSSWIIDAKLGDDTPLDEFKSLQKRGEQGVLLLIIERLIKVYSVENLPIELVNIYIDIVHLGGNYKEAVDICQKYLNDYSEKEILDNRQLLKMSIRQIHHSMFFVDVNVLLDDAKQLLNKIDINRFPEEYNELLFLLGGNLGVLSGQFDFAKKWLVESLEFSKNKKLFDFTHRTIRKIADICIYQDKLNEAESLITPVININMASIDIDSRYKIYLFSSLAELYRKKRNLDDAKVCYKKIYDKACENNMIGWKGHSYLGMGMVDLDQGDYEDAKCNLELAKRIYENINQMWGIINAETVQLLIDKRCYGFIDQNRIQEVLSLSKKMNYLYNYQFLEKLINDNEEYFELFFL